MGDWIVSKQTVETTNPQAAVETKPEGDVGVIKKPEVEVIPPISEYERLNQHPYLYDYLKLKDSGIIKDALYEKHYKGMIKEIDDFVIAEIDKNKLQPTIDSYKEVMKKVKAYLEIGDNDVPDKTLKKLKTYSGVVSKKRILEKRITNAVSKLNKLMGHDND